MTVFTLKTGIESCSNPGGKRGASSNISRPSTLAGAPPMSPCLRATSAVNGRPARMCIPSTAGSSRAPRLSTFETTTYRTPAARIRSSVPERRNASRKSP